MMNGLFTKPRGGRREDIRKSGKDRVRQRARDKGVRKRGSWKERREEQEEGGKEPMRK